jgi:XTP/dITP diphosphohydrolase
MSYTKVVLASNNAGKVREFNQLFKAFNIEVVPQQEFNIEEVEETGLTFVENALLKARHAAKISGLPAIADDSGIEVDALQGAPGIYSARFSGENATDKTNCDKLLRDLKDTPTDQRNARFQCLLVFMRHGNDPVPLICQGSWEGQILTEPQGDNGFGYDPIFYIEAHQCSAAQLQSEVKNKLSHRGKALTCLVKKLAL